MVIEFLFVLMLLIVSINDFLFFRIEDEIVITLLILYGVSCLIGESGGNFANGIIVALVIGVITIILNRFNMIGGGDVKLLFPLILFAENHLSDFALGTAFSGFLLSIIYISFGKKIFFFRRKILHKIDGYHKGGNKCASLKYILLSYSKINKKIVDAKCYADDALKQEIPFGVALSFGSLYTVICNIIAR